jgi:hypothetical protein
MLAAYVRREKDTYCSPEQVGQLVPAGIVDFVVRRGDLTSAVDFIVRGRDLANVRLRGNFPRFFDSLHGHGARNRERDCDENEVAPISSHVKKY